MGKSGRVAWEFDELTKLYAHPAVMRDMTFLPQRDKQNSTIGDCFDVKNGKDTRQVYACLDGYLFDDLRYGPCLPLDTTAKLRMSSGTHLLYGNGRQRGIYFRRLHTG